MPEYFIPSNITDGSGGIEDIFVVLSQQVSFLGPGILLLIFFTITGAGYFVQDRKMGKGNFPMWVAISGLITTTGAFFLFLIVGIVNIETVGFSIMLTIMAVAWFLVSSRD